MVLSAMFQLNDDTEATEAQGGFPGACLQVPAAL